MEDFGVGEEDQMKSNQLMKQPTPKASSILLCPAVLPLGLNSHAHTKNSAAGN